MSNVADGKKWRSFKSNKVAYCSLYFVVLLVLISIFTEFISNNKPILLQYKGNLYFPIYQKITSKDLGVEKGPLLIDYKKLDLKDSLVLWPLNKFGPFETNTALEKYPSPPGVGGHWLGTDNQGRDLFARLVYGLRNSLIFAVAVWLMSYFIGIVIGAIQGFFGGRVDFIFQRSIEIFSAIPFLFLLIILVSFLQPNVFLLAALTTIFGWIGISYYIRAEFFKLRKLEFVEAARALGAGRIKLFTKHLIPNSLTPVITLSPFAITGNIGVLASLDYLGFGLPPPAASWGELLNQAKEYFDHAWWLAFYPALTLACTLVVINFVGEGVREAFDPRSS